MLYLPDGQDPYMPNVVAGAWYNPLKPGRIGTRDKQGNPNGATSGSGTSALADMCTAQRAIVVRN
jgi:biotin/methionine sulfoxide reductase